MKNITLQVACATAILVSSIATVAAKTYTPSQLNQMIGSGKPPAQGSPSTQTEPTAFSPCVSNVKSIVASITPNYPAKIVVDNRLLFMVKVWTNDSAMTLSCSAPDTKMIITTSKYL